MWSMGMECRYLGWEGRPSTWAEASSQRTLNASQRRVEFIDYGISQLGSDPARFVSRQVSLAALRKGDGRMKAVGRIVQIIMKLVACSWSSQGMDLTRT